LAPLLVVEKLVAGYQGRAVVKGVSLALDRGEKLVIMGPNGAGKSTLLKAVPRLVEPMSGRIVFDGIEVTSLPPRELRRVRARIGYLPQGSTLSPHMKVLDNIVLPLRVVHGLDKREAVERAMKYLSMLGVDWLADRYPLQLSGGQQQRVALARALAMEPDLLLLDEPTANLDPDSRLDVLEALYRVASLGKAMIVVTHEVEFARRVADRVAVMRDGRIVEEGTPSRILGR
jgi:polar amino acid transport system ATP-binding protein